LNLFHRALQLLTFDRGGRDVISQVLQSDVEMSDVKGDVIPEPREISRRLLSLEGSGLDSRDVVL
jgi:hypothetical protein